jgi:hypothetical protein
VVVGESVGEQALVGLPPDRRLSRVRSYVAVIDGVTWYEVVAHRLEVELLEPVERSDLDDGGG